MKFWEDKWYVKATVWPVRQRKYWQLVHWRQFPAPQLICLSLLWLLIGWFWSIILIGCCEHPSFIRNTKWKTAVRNLVSMAWHDLHDGFRLRHRNIYHTWISRSFFLQLKFFTTANNIVPIFPLARFLAWTLSMAVTSQYLVVSYLIQLYENLRLVRRIAYCKPGILTDWDPYPSPPSRSFGSPLFQIHPSLVLGNHLKRTRKKRGKWRGKVKESDGDR